MSFQLTFDQCLKPIQRWFGVGLTVNTVAIHSKAINLPASQIEAWYNDSVSWLREFGQESLALSFVGVKGFEDADTYAFAKADKKIRRLGFSSLPYVSIYAALPCGMDSLRPRFSVSLRNSQTPGIASVFIWAWEDMGPDITRKVFLKQCQWAHAAGVLDYAFALQQSSRMLPEIEAMQDSFSPRLIVKSRSVTGGGFPTKHILESGGHTIDYLREVYPIQIISSEHLSHRIQGETLKDWITSSPNHGLLTPHSENHWIWEVSAQDIQSVRNELNEYGLLTLYLPDMKRIYEDYGRLRNI